MTWPFETMTEQEVFDTVATHLLKQKKKSIVIEASHCGYRGENGLMCAAGVLIPDAEYETTMEGLFWEELVNAYDLTTRHRELICNLQKIHDCHPPGYWRLYLEQLAKAFKLKVTFKTADLYLKKAIQSRIARYRDTHLYTMQEWFAKFPETKNQMDGALVLTAEGELYAMLNGYRFEKNRAETSDKFQALAEKFGFQMQQYHAWSWYFFPTQLKTIFAKRETTG